MADSYCKAIMADSEAPLWPLFKDHLTMKGCYIKRHLRRLVNNFYGRNCGITVARDEYCYLSEEMSSFYFELGGSCLILWRLEPQNLTCSKASQYLKGSFCA
jgi:hypothetical protein